jgi:hypothetical protein
MHADVEIVLGLRFIYMHFNGGNLIGQMDATKTGFWDRGYTLYSA